MSGAQSEDGSVQTSQEGQELDPRDSEAHRCVGFDDPESQEIFNLTQSTAALPSVGKAAALLPFKKFGRLTPTRDFSGGEPRGSAPEKS